MYHMKNIVSQEQPLLLPNCMYLIRNPIEECPKAQSDINIRDQVIKFLKKMPNTQLIELEGRQDKLLQKLDNLYERIKNISFLCNISNDTKATKKAIDIISPEEIVVVLNPNILPWFLNKFLKEVKLLNVTWHIHSSVPTEKIPKIEAFFRKYQDLYTVKDAKINLRLIFKSESTTSELKFSSLAFPILGAVNIIRYLCVTYGNIVPYDYFNHEVDAMLDTTYQLETAASEKSRALLISKIFLQAKDWIYQDTFSIIDLAVFSVIYQWHNGIKCVPKKWFNNCEKLIL